MDIVLMAHSRLSFRLGTAGRRGVIRVRIRRPVITAIIIYVHIYNLISIMHSNHFQTG